MEVVVHDHIGMDGHLEFLSLLQPEFPQTDAIGIVPDNGLAVIAALNHMMWIARKGESRKPGHEVSPTLENVSLIRI